MTYAPMILAVTVLLCTAVLSFSVWYENTSDREPYTVGFVFGILTALAVLTLLGGIG